MNLYQSASPVEKGVYNICQSVSKVTFDSSSLCKASRCASPKVSTTTLICTCSPKAVGKGKQRFPEFLTLENTLPPAHRERCILVPTTGGNVTILQSRRPRDGKLLRAENSKQKLTSTRNNNSRSHVHHKKKPTRRRQRFQGGAVFGADFVNLKPLPSPPLALVYLVHI